MASSEEPEIIQPFLFLQVIGTTFVSRLATWKTAKMRSIKQDTSVLKSLDFFFSLTKSFEILARDVSRERSFSTEQGRDRDITIRLASVFCSPSHVLNTATDMTQPPFLSTLTDFHFGELWKMSSFHRSLRQTNRWSRHRSAQMLIRTRGIPRRCCRKFKTLKDGLNVFVMHSL